MFEQAKQDSLLDIEKGEEILDKAKSLFLKNYNNKDKSFFDEKGDFKTDKIESVFKEVELNIGIGGSCNLKKCNLMVNFCFTLFN